MVLDQTGELANMTRHDYLPFGEELFAPTGGRSAAQGYGGIDGVRQQFTSNERDIETGLDYFGARYYSSTQGRFTNPDRLLTSAERGQPQIEIPLSISIDKTMSEKIEVSLDEVLRLFLFLEDLNHFFHSPTKYRDPRLWWRMSKEECMTNSARCTIAYFLVGYRNES